MVQMLLVTCGCTGSLRHACLSSWPCYWPGWHISRHYPEEPEEQGANGHFSRIRSVFFSTQPLPSHLHTHTCSEALGKGLSGNLWVMGRSVLVKESYPRRKMRWSPFFFSGRRPCAMWEPFMVTPRDVKSQWSPNDCP